MTLVGGGIFSFEGFFIQTEKLVDWAKNLKKITLYIHNTSCTRTFGRQVFKSFFFFTSVYFYKLYMFCMHVFV